MCDKREREFLLTQTAMQILDSVLSTSQVILVFGATLVSILILDAIWFMLIAREFTRSSLNVWLNDRINWYAAGALYVILAAGIVIFVVLPAIDHRTGAGLPITTPAIYGAIFGLVAYSTYELTNLATVKNWPLKFALVDIVWGCVLASAASVVGTSFGEWLLRTKC